MLYFGHLIPGDKRLAKIQHKCFPLKTFLADSVALMKGFPHTLSCDDITAADSDLFRDLPSVSGCLVLTGKTKHLQSIEKALQAEITRSLQVCLIGVLHSLTFQKLTMNLTRLQFIEWRRERTFKTLFKDTIDAILCIYSC